MQQLKDYQQLIVPVLKKYEIKRAAIFGSFAKGIHTTESDLDLLIEPTNGFTMYKMLQLESEIARMIERKIDIVEFSALKLSIRNEVLQSAVTIL